MTWSVRRWPLAVTALAALMGLYGCGNSTAGSANSLVSPSGPAVSPITPVVSPSTPVVGLAPPRPSVCQPILSAADLADVASEADAVVEGDSPGKTSVVVDFDASQFDVTKVLKAVPGVDPTGAIEIIFGPRGTGYFLPPGKYLLFLEYIPISKVYSVVGSGVGNAVINADFLINGDTATEQSCGSGPSDGAEPSAVASWNAADGAPPISAAELEGWVGQLNLGRALTSPAAAVVAVCKPQNVRITNPPSLDGGMGGLTVKIVFQNTGSGPCSLTGWPTVTTPGMRTKVQYQTTTGAGFMVPVSRIVLAPGESGDAALDLFGVPGSAYSQACFAAGSWAVTLPGSHQPALVPWPTYQGACPGGTVEVSPFYIPDPESVTGFSSADPATISQLGPFDSPPTSP